MIQIKLLKDWKEKKIGDIINISKKGAEQFIAEGAGEILDVDKEKVKGTRKWIAKNYFKNATYSEEEEKIIIGKKEEIKRVIDSFYDKKDLAFKIFEVQPYFYDKARIWWVWNYKKFKWCMVDDVDILNLVNDISNADTISSKERVEIIEAMRQHGRKSIPKKIKNTWIQFKDKIIDISNEEEICATPEYFVTNPIPWGLNKDKFINTPTIDKIFEEWVGKKNIKTLYEIIAYCLIQDYPLHRIFCFIGSGMNGKSKFLELLRTFIGNDNTCSTELDTLINSRFEVTRLHKKLVCQMGETNFNEINKTSILKKLSGGDLIGFEYKNKDLFEEKNYAKIIISTNNLPTTTDKTIGFYRRWMIVDFPNQFSEGKDILLDIPEEEYECLARKSIIILKELIKDRKFTNEGSIEERIKRYEDHSDPLEKFLKEYTEEDFNSFIWKFDFEKKLNEWCKENRHREMSEVAIGKKMKEKGISQELKQSNWLTEGIKKQFRAWVGIKWKENNQDKQDKQVN